jgi:hypothetical protein
MLKTGKKEPKIPVLGGKKPSNREESHDKVFCRHYHYSAFKYVIPLRR